MTVSREEILAVLNNIYPFRKLDPALLERVIANSEACEFAADEVIYQQGEDATHLFLVLSGRVSMMVTAGEEQEQIVTDHKPSGSFFGYEVLYDGVQRLRTALTASYVTAIRFDREQLILLVEEIPGLLDAFELLTESTDLLGRVNLPWLGSDETVYYIARRHPIFLILRMIPPGLLALIFLPALAYVSASTQWSYLTPLLLVAALGLVVLAWFIWIIIDWMNDYSIVTNQRVLFQERILLLYESRQESPLNAIMSVATETSLLGRIFDYGNVVVRTYAGMIVLPGLKSPAQVAKIVEGEWFHEKLARTQQEKVQLEKRIRDRVIERKPASTPAAPPKLPQTKNLTSRVSDYLATMFRIQFELNGNLTYRKHWFILLINIWLPTLVLFALFLFLILSVTRVIEILSVVSSIAIVFVLGIIVLAWWSYIYLDWRNDYYLVTDEQVVDVYKKPLGREERKSAPLKNIQSIEFERQGIIRLALNYGTVYILVGDATLTFDDVFNPAGIQRELFKRIAERDYREKQQEAANEQQRMTEWLEIYDRLHRQPGSSEANS